LTKHTKRSSSEKRSFSKEKATRTGAFVSHQEISFEEIMGGGKANRALVDVDEKRGRQTQKAGVNGLNLGRHEKFRQEKTSLKRFSEGTNGGFAERGLWGKKGHGLFPFQEKLQRRGRWGETGLQS